jgi:hypothetical protein
MPALDCVNSPVASGHSVRRKPVETARNGLAERGAPGSRRSGASPSLVRPGAARRHRPQMRRSGVGTGQVRGVRSIQATRQGLAGTRPRRLPARRQPTPGLASHGYSTRVFLVDTRPEPAKIARDLLTDQAPARVCPVRAAGWLFLTSDALLMAGGVKLRSAAQRAA